MKKHRSKNSHKTLWLTLLLSVAFIASPAMAQQSSRGGELPNIDDSAEENAPPVYTTPEPSPDYRQNIINSEGSNNNTPARSTNTNTGNNNVNIGEIPEAEVVEENDVAMPPSEELAQPVAKPQPVDEKTARALDEINKATEGQDLFYDADQLVPSGEFLEKGGTVKVNPATQPASRYIVVNKKHGKNSSEAMLVAASRASTLGRHESALQIYDDLYAHNKRDPRILMGRAIALQNLGRIDEAIMAYDDFLQRRPDDINAQVNMLGLMAEQYPAVALQRLLALHDDHERHIGIIAQIAVTYGQLERYDEAMKYFGMASGIEPNNPTHFYNMAIVADKGGDKETAIELYEKALQVDALQGSGMLPRDAIYERLASLR